MLVSQFLVQNYKLLFSLQKIYKNVYIICYLKSICCFLSILKKIDRSLFQILLLNIFLQHKQMFGLNGSIIINIKKVSQKCGINFITFFILDGKTFWLEIEHTYSYNTFSSIFARAITSSTLFFIWFLSLETYTFYFSQKNCHFQDDSNHMWLLAITELMNTLDISSNKWNIFNNLLQIYWYKLDWSCKTILLAKTNQNC